jgi:hypothetical protein
MGGGFRTVLSSKEEAAKAFGFSLASRATSWSDSALSAWAGVVGREFEPSFHHRPLLSFGSVVSFRFSSEESNFARGPSRVAAGALEASDDRGLAKRSKATDSDPDKDEGVEAAERGGAG